MEYSTARLSFAGALGLCLCVADAHAEYVINTPGPLPLSLPVITVYDDQQHFTYVDTNNILQDLWYGADEWHLQQFTEGSSSVSNEWVINNPGPPPDGSPAFVSIYDGQQHFTYIDKNNILQDLWYEPGWRRGSGWHLQQLTQGSSSVPNEWVINTPGPPPADPYSVSISIYDGQQHFTYIDTNNILQDVWYGADGWHLQQLTLGSSSVPNEWVINTPGPPSILSGIPVFVSIYDGQQHFTYIDANKILQDIWYGADGWHLQQLTQGFSSLPNEWVISAPGPQAEVLQAVTVYNGQLHFTYADNNYIIQDVWYGSDGWHLQQLTQGTSSIPDEWLIESPGPSLNAPPISRVLVSIYNDQQHFTYIDTNRILQDVWYGADGWHLQQLTQGSSSIPNEWVINTPGPRAYWLPVITVYNGQQHFTYGDYPNRTLQDVWYGSGGWHLQQPPGPAGWAPVLASIYNDQLHFTYGDDNGVLHDVWYDSSGWHLQQLTQ